MSQRRFYVYILASRSKVIYVGVTNDLQRRLAEHRTGTGSRFTSRYRVWRLVYSESCSFVRDALYREKQLKGWTRAKKVALIESANPDWDDLSTAPLPDPSLRSG